MYLLAVCVRYVPWRMQFWGFLGAAPPIKPVNISVGTWGQTHAKCNHLEAWKPPPGRPDVSSEWNLSRLRTPGGRSVDLGTRFGVWGSRARLGRWLPSAYGACLCVRTCDAFVSDPQAVLICDQLRRETTFWGDSGRGVLLAVDRSPARWGPDQELGTFSSTRPHCPEGGWRRWTEGSPGDGAP